MKYSDIEKGQNFCYMHGKGVCRYECENGLCSNEHPCTNKRKVVDLSIVSSLISNYKNKLSSLMFWRAELEEELLCTTDSEKALLEEIIKDLEGLL